MFALQPHADLYGPGAGRGRQRRRRTETPAWASLTMFERRLDRRVSTSKRALIKFGAAGTEIVCSVNDLTPRGAGLSVISSFGVPRVFQLAIDGEAATRHCKVIWTDGRKLGVAFE
ncbi:MAG TPA: hypothetical protein VMG39_06100 [Pseudolabrys sp.]|nr:hypothetical protein [Pseudolabrys sp.]